MHIIISIRSRVLPRDHSGKNKICLLLWAGGGAVTWLQGAWKVSGVSRSFSDRLSANPCVCPPSALSPEPPCCGQLLKFGRVGGRGFCDEIRLLSAFPMASFFPGTVLTHPVFWLPRLRCSPLSFPVHFNLKNPFTVILLRFGEGEALMANVQPTMF